MQPQGGGTAAQDADIFVHDGIPLLFQHQYALKKEDYTMDIQEFVQVIQRTLSIRVESGELRVEIYIVGSS